MPFGNGLIDEMVGVRPVLDSVVVDQRRPAGYRPPQPPAPVALELE